MCHGLAAADPAVRGMFEMLDASDDDDSAPLAGALDSFPLLSHPPFPHLPLCWRCLRFGLGKRFSRQGGSGGWRRQIELGTQLGTAPPFLKAGISSPSFKNGSGPLSCSASRAHPLLTSTAAEKSCRRPSRA